MSDLLHRLGLAVVSMERKAGGWPWLSHGPEVVCSLLSEARAEIARLRNAVDEQTGRAAWHYDCLAQCEERVIQRDAEIERLRTAIRRLAEQDATLSVSGGNLTVTMDATLTDAEREAVETAVSEAEAHQHTVQAATLRGLLERTK